MRRSFGSGQGIAGHRRHMRVGAFAAIGALSFLGIIEDATADVLEQAWDWRNRIVHGRSASPGPSREEVGRVMDACRELVAATKLQATG